MSKSEHLNEVNLVRALAIVGVLMVHSTSSAVGQTIGTPYLPFYNFLNIFFKFGTPTFIFLSSFVLFYNYYHRPFSKETIIRFYKNRLLYILVPYVMFSGIYFTLKNYSSMLVDAKSYTLNRFLDQLMWGDAHDHLYFVFISIQFYLMFPFLLYFFQKAGWARRYAVLLGFALQWGFIFLNRDYFQIVQKGSISFSYMAYFFLGVFLGIYFEKIKDWIIIRKENMLSLKGVVWISLWGLWIVAAFLYVSLWYETRANGTWRQNLYYESYWNFHTFLSAIILFQLAFVIYRHAPKLIVRAMLHLASVSFGIYLFHPIVLRFYRFYQPAKEGIVFHLWVAGGFLTALIVSWIVVTVVTKIKFSWILFGNKPRGKKRAVSETAVQVREAKP
ncbi:acyltransferase [Paenibacillus abyssi]|uniref:Acyltransferase 3 n=1 Tax=Paenibacillus abyssi TaxID=1340531 RepID=A0A917D5G5_9BACL|nr:acyltransferase [Paenibacillus abyssi]GGG11408.1 acyltransferase 3 [Paenibacillus abyssi]